MTLAHDPGIVLMPMLSPLPPRFWWKVEVWLTHDSVHLCLMRKTALGSVEKASRCAVVDFSIKDMDDIVQYINEESYDMVNKYFTRANSPEVPKTLHRIVRTGVKFEAGRHADRIRSSRSAGVTG